MAHEMRNGMTEAQMHTGETWEQLIHAYVDDMLPPRQRLEVEEYLSIHPEEAQRVADFRNQNRAFHKLYDRHLSGPLPEATQMLEDKLVRKLTRKRAARKLPRVSAAAVIVFLVTVGGWYGARQYLAPDSSLLNFGTLAWNSGERSSPPVGGFKRQQAESAEKVSNATASQLSRAGGSAAPNLNPLGFRLTATRQIGYGDGKGALQLTYESKTGQQVTVYVSSSAKNGNQKITLLQQGPVWILAWTRNGRTYSVIGEVARDQMMAIGAAINGESVSSPAPAQDPSAPLPAPKRMQKDGDAAEDGGKTKIRPTLLK